MIKTKDIYIQKLEGGEIPTYGSIHSTGADLYAAEDIVIKPFEIKVLPLNIKVAFDESIDMQIRARSGLSLKTTLRIANSIGTIDADYKDIVGVILENTYNVANLPYQIAANIELLKDLNINYKKVRLADYLLAQGVHLNNFITEKHIASHIGGEYIYLDSLGNPYGTIYIKKGDKIAQMVIAEHYKANFIEVDDVSHIGSDRGGGYGHTGINANTSSLNTIVED